MSDRKPLMPKATAAWLVDNTALTFEQIADFCGMHMLEVKGIADGDVAAGIKGMDPISSGQMTREEIQRGEKDPGYRLKLAVSKVEIPQVKSKRGPRYTPVSRRHDRPNAVLWLLRNHPELRESQIMRLVGTTKPTIAQVRNRTHWNSSNLVPQDPVTLGLCSQIDLDEEVAKGAKRAAKDEPAMEPGGTLMPADETTGAAAMEHEAEPEPAEPKESEAEETARVLASLKGLTGEAEDVSDEEAVDESEAEADEQSGEEPEDPDTDAGEDHDEPKP